MVLTYEEATAAIYAALEAAWLVAGHKAASIKWPNLSYKPSASPWIRPQIVGGEGSRLTMGGVGQLAGVNEARGLVAVSVFVEPNKGDGQMRKAYGILSRAFNRRDVRGVHFEVPSDPVEVTPDDQAWAQWTFTIPFWYEVAA